MLKICHSADLHLGAGTSHGPTRASDYLAAFDRICEHAKGCDAFLLAGDCYDCPTPSPSLQYEFARRVRDVAEHVPTIVLVGNHDHGVRDGSAHPVDLFDAVRVPNVTVVRTASVTRVETRNGPLLVAGLPFVPKAKLLTKLTQLPGAAETTALMVDLLVKTLDRLAMQVTAHRLQHGEQIPCVLAGHWWVEGACPGGFLPRSTGPLEVVLPIEAVQNPEFDACLFGHVHQAQVLGRPQPLVSYCGSPERISFAEQDEPRTFSVVSVERGGAFVERHYTGAREFLTLDLGECADVLGELDDLLSNEDGHQPPPVRNAVVRVTYSLPVGAPTPSEREIRRRLAEYGAAHVASVKRLTTSQEFRARSTAIATAQGPLDALGVYFDTTHEPPARRERLLALARKQIEARSEVAA